MLRRAHQTCSMQMSGFDYIRLHRRAALAARVSLLTVVACLAVPSAAAELGAANAPAACAQIGISARAVDFRLRDSTPELRFEFGDNPNWACSISRPSSSIKLANTPRLHTRRAIPCRDCVGSYRSWAISCRPESCCCRFLGQSQLPAILRAVLSAWPANIPRRHAAVECNATACRKTSR
jgi:hypothetical protein